MLNNSEQRVNSSSSDGRLNNNQGDNHHQQAMITLSNTMQCIDTSDIIITGSTPRRLSQKEVRVYKKCKNYKLLTQNYQSTEIRRQAVASLLTTLDTRVQSRANGT